MIDEVAFQIAFKYHFFLALFAYKEGAGHTFSDIACGKTAEGELEYYLSLEGRVDGIGFTLNAYTSGYCLYPYH